MALSLLFVSFVVGMILATFGFEPESIIQSFVRAVRRSSNSGGRRTPDRAHSDDRRDSGASDLVAVARARRPARALNPGSGFGGPLGQDRAEIAARRPNRKSAGFPETARDAAARRASRRRASFRP